MYTEYSSANIVVIKSIQAFALDYFIRKYKVFTYKFLRIFDNITCEPLEKPYMVNVGNICARDMFVLFLDCDSWFPCQVEAPWNSKFESFLTS